MHYNSPGRPKIGYVPSLIAQDGQSLSSAVLPMTIYPWAIDSFRLQIPNNENGHGCTALNKIVRRENLVQFLQNYFDNPEQFLVVNFNWTWPDSLEDQQLRKCSAQLSLPDLCK